MEEVGESRGGRGSYIDKTQNRKAPLPPPTTPLLPIRATRLCIRLHLNYAGRRTKGRAMMSGPLVNSSSQTAAPVQFPFFFYYMAEVPSSTFNPRHLLQLQSSSPTSSLFNFSPPCQLHPPSPPTSTLVAFQFLNPVAMLFPFSSPSP
jgi:hypothetical protein